MRYMFDNHEIMDDYRLPNGTTETYVNAARTWRKYSGRGYPDPMVEDGSCYTFQTVNAGGFLLDTRLYQYSFIGNLRKITIKYEDSSLITPININWLLIILRLIFFGFPVFKNS